MEHLANQFTLIDFFGIFAPGAVFVLACNYYILDMSAPCTKFFGGDIIMLAVYFIALAYLCGNLLHQVGAALEKRIANEVNVYRYLQRWQGLIDMAYKERFNTDFPTDELGQLEAGRDIFHYVQRNVRPQRIVLFNAFYSMGRTALVLLPVLAIITFFFESDKERLWYLLLAYTGAATVFYYQWRDFDRKCIQEAYMLLISEYIDGKNKAGS